MFRIRTILHPTDFSESSFSAFELACSLACDHGAHLIVMHVIPPPVTHGEAVARQANGYYEEVSRQLFAIRPSDPEVQGEPNLSEGDPAEEIVWVAEESRSDLIVMGTHGRSGIRRLFLGSVAEQVLRNAPCPVLTAKALTVEKAVPEPHIAGPSAG